MGANGSIEQISPNAISWNFEREKSILPSTFAYSGEFTVFGGRHEFYFHLERFSPEDDWSLQLRSLKKVELHLDIHVKLVYIYKTEEFSLTNHYFIGNCMELSKLDAFALLQITCTFFRAGDITKGFGETGSEKVDSGSDHENPESESDVGQVETYNNNAPAEVRKEVSRITNLEEERINRIKNESTTTRDERENNTGESDVSENFSSIQGETSNSEMTETVKSRDLLELSENLKDLFLDEEESDITFNVGDQRYPAHKLIIRARSPVFYAMLKHDMKEKRHGSVDIEDCDPQAFKDFLLYLYTGKLDSISNDNVFELYHMSDKYEVNELKMKCYDFIFNNLSVDTICEVISLAVKHSERDLLEHATNFFIKNAKDILLTVNWQTFVKENPVEANELFIKTLNK